MTQATFINYGANPTNFSNIPESHPAVVDIDDDGDSHMQEIAENWGYEEPNEHEVIHHEELTEDE